MIASKLRHHYLLTYDAETGQWFHDIDTEDAKFTSGTIFNSATDRWDFAYGGDGVYVPNEDTISEQIYKAISTLNEGQSNEPV